MKSFILGVVFAAITLPTVTYAANNEAGVPLSPAEAAGDWSLESAGHTLCLVTLGAGQAPGGFSAKAAPECQGALSAWPVAWTPTPVGMALLDAGGQPGVKFIRWSNSLCVSHRSSGVDVQLRRRG